MESVNFESAFAKIENLAKADGAEVEMLVERSEKFSVSFQQGKPEKFDSSASHCAGLRVVLDGAEGYSFSENLSDAALVDAYREASENAKFTGRAIEPSLRVRLLASTSDVEEMQELYNDSLASLTIEQKLERARELEASALALDKRVASVPYNAYVETEAETQILTSTGLRRRQRQTAVYGYTYALAKDGEESRMDGKTVFTRDALELDTESIAIEAARRAIARLGSSPPETGRYPVVIDNKVVCSLMGLIADYFSAKSVYEKSSLFANDLGKKLASSKLTIVDDPFFKGGVSTRAFDSEGAPSQVTPLIQEGVVSNFLTNSVFAERLKLPHTASASRGARSQLDVGISNMIVQPGTASRELLLSTYPKVIYITEFSGFHAGYNSGSGDFSLQADGELWENGRRVRPLCNFVVAGNIKQLLADIEEVSSRMSETTGSVIAPDILVRELSVAGK